MNEKLTLITEEIERVTGTPEEIQEQLINLLIALNIQTDIEKQIIIEWIDKRGYAIELGISPDLLILKFESAYDNKLKRQQEERTHVQISLIQNTIKEINTDYSEGKIPPHHYSAEIAKQSHALNTLLTRGIEPQPITSKDLENPIVKPGVQIDLLNMELPRGTLSFVGGRPGHGKTTLMLNCAVELLLKKIPVEFYTYEESQTRLTYKLLIATYYYIQKNQLRNIDFSYIDNRPWGHYKTPLRAIIGYAINKTFPPPFLKDTYYQYLKPWLDSGRLKVYDRPGDYISLNQLLQKNPDSIALCDYIQKIPGGGDNRQIAIQKISGTILDTLVKLDKVGIFGAQFRRNLTNDEKKKDDSTKKYDYPNTSYLDLDLFRESGDIEQDANIAIGIKSKRGPVSNTRLCSIKILKNRDGESGQILNIDHSGLFWHMEKNNKNNQQDTGPDQAEITQKNSGNNNPTKYWENFTP